MQWNEEVTLELDAAADVGLQVLHGDTRETLSAAAIDAAVLEGLGNGPVQHQLLAASGNADRVVQVRAGTEHCWTREAAPQGSFCLRFPRPVLWESRRKGSGKIQRAAEEVFVALQTWE